MRRIGLLTTSYPRFPGDVAGCFVEGFAETLASIGNSVEVHCPEPAERSARAPRPGIEVIEVAYMRPRRAARTFYGDGVPENVRASPWLGIGVPAFAAALDRSVARAVPHLSALVSHWAIPCGLIAARHAGARPHVAVFHSADVHLLEQLPMSRALARALLRGTTAAWFVSDELRERFARCAGGLPRELRVHVAPMGFEQDIAPPPSRSEARARLGLERFTVLSVSRLVPIKGLDDAVLGLGRIGNVELVIAGQGPERARLERLARSSSTRVRFEGHLVGERKRALLHAADAFVLPSVIADDGRREGVPTALLEAMAAGLPIVATRTGGIPEIVRDGVEGLLVPPRRPDAIAAAIARLADDRALASSLGSAASARAAGFGWAAKREKLRELLER